MADAVGLWDFNAGEAVRQSLGRGEVGWREPCMLPRVQMASRQMQVDRRIGELGMSEQKLNGTEIGAGLQQVRGEAMP